MGNRTNMLTLRPEHSLNYTRLNLNEFWYIYSISKLLGLLFFKKKIFLTNLNLFLVENKIFLTLFFFFRASKFIKLLKMRKFKKELLKKSPFNTFPSLFTSFKALKKNLIVYTVINLNFFLKKKKKKITFFFKELKRDGIVLFPRRFNFFLDFLQISILLIHQKIKAAFLVKVLVEIFRFLQKKMHSKFFNFLSQYFKLIVLESGYSNQKKTFKLKGLKIIITGKLKGKPRSHTYINTYGSVPIQTISCGIDYAKQHAFTIYGVFGIKLWLYF
jgi:hypothetical protein